MRRTSHRTPAAAAPDEGPLLDALGRVVHNLRVSVTDRCNLRCTYCMPPDGLTWLPRAELLTFEEYVRLVSVFVGLGVSAIKLTGGEPTLRADLPALVRMLREAGPDLEISMTTNGVRLERLAGPLAEAGLDRVSVSCDSLDRRRFAEMTKRDALGRVLRGMDAAAAAGLTPIKVNCVVLRGKNDREVVAFARWARGTGRVVRFIEFMPLDGHRAWDRELVVPSARILETIDRTYPLVPTDRGAAPARAFRFADGAAGGVGVVASVTEPFCGSCNRIRLTADGRLCTCLFALGETDLRGALRSGAGDGELVGAIRAGVWSKWPGHRISHPDFVAPARTMSMIGG